MRVRVIAVPYHLGREEEGMGRGPNHWLEAGLEEALRKLGNQVSTFKVRRRRSFAEELIATEDVNKGVATAVGEAVAEGSFPFILAGNCNSSLGTLGGLGTDPIGVVWFDAHGDFNTPETSPSGFFDGMVVSILTGACYPEIWGRVAARPVIPESDVVFVGVRDLDPEERVRLKGSRVTTVTADTIRSGGVKAGLGPALQELRSRVAAAYLHIDLDALDPEFAPCNSYQTKGGLTLADMKEATAMIGELFKVRAAALTAFDPEYDVDGRATRTGIEIAGHISGALVRT